MPTSLAQAVLTATIRDTAAALLDPDTLSLTVTDPNGGSNTYTYAAAQITRTSAGLFTKTIYCDLPGDWRYEFLAATSLLRKKTVGQFTVRE